MDSSKYVNSPVKINKQGTLNQFFKKYQYQQQQSQLSNIQTPLTPSKQTPLTPSKQTPLTPSKLKYNNNQHDSNKFAGKISSPLGSFRTYHPLIGRQQYKVLDINSNMKLKIDDIFQQSLETNNKKYFYNQNNYNQNNQNNNNNQALLFNQSPNNNQQSLEYNQKLLIKNKQKSILSRLSENNFYQIKQQKSNLSQQPLTSQLINKKYDKFDSQLDYDLSIQPQQIKIPQVKRYQNIVNQFNIHNDDYQKPLDSNFLITPENSLIKSPQKQKYQQYQQYQNYHFTPQNDKNKPNKQPPTSQIIQRLRFNNAQTSQLKSNDKQQISPKKSQPFVKNLQSPTAYNLAIPINKIPSPTKSQKKSPSIISSPSKSTKKQNKDILSSDDQDASELLTKIRQLQSQVTQLKSHKYQFAINKYRQDMKYELQKHLQTSIKQINSRYDQKQVGLKKQAQVQIQLFNKSLQDINKYKKTYAIILNQLRQNKDKIEDEYKQKVQQVRKYKQRLIHEWKRQSNEQIKKILNNSHTKHTIKLSSSSSLNKIVSKQKLQQYSKQKNKPFSKDKISPHNSSK